VCSSDLIASCIFTDSTTSIFKLCSEACFFTSLIRSNGQTTPGSKSCRAQTILSTDGICLISSKLTVSLSLPNQRNEVFISLFLPVQHQYTILYNLNTFIYCSIFLISNSRHTS